MLTGSAWTATLAVLAPLIEMFLKAIGASVNDYFDRQRNAQNARELGQVETANRINVETLETKDAMDAVPRPTDDDVADSLRSGTF